MKNCISFLEGKLCEHHLIVIPLLRARFILTFIGNKISCISDILHIEMKGRRTLLLEDKDLGCRVLVQNVWNTVSVDFLFLFRLQTEQVGKQDAYLLMLSVPPFQALPVGMSQ